MDRLLLVLLVGLAAASLPACSHPVERAASRTPRPLPASSVPAPGAPEIPWSRKTHAQRLEFMGLVVFPKMKPLFQAYSAEGYKNFRCQTCHGDDMEAVEFKMPNSLYALPAADPMQAALAYDEKTARFMADQVVPAMRALLGKDDPSVERRFGCLSCHQKE